jgi:sugar phosphate isomerase/epimerase
MIGISQLAFNENGDLAKFCAKYQPDYIEVVPSRMEQIDPLLKSVTGSDSLPKLRSAQSLLFGVEENIFTGKKEADAILEKLSAVIDLLAPLGVEKYVFGSPKNRHRTDSAWADKAESYFFGSINELCGGHDVKFCIEHVPKSYGSNYLTTVSEVVNFLKRNSWKNISLNLDLGNFIEEGEGIEEISYSLDYVGHVQLSSFGLGSIRENRLHGAIAQIFQGKGFDLTLEMLNGDLQTVSDSWEYLCDTFNI